MKIANKIILSFAVTGVMTAAAAMVLAGRGAHAAVLFIAVLAVVTAAGSGACVIISRPIRRLSNGARIIRSGNLDYKVGTGGKDEIGALSKAFDEMATDLKDQAASIDILNSASAEHEKTEQQLRASEEYYRSLFEHSNDAVFIYDFEGKIIDVNNKACDMLGYSKEELLKIPFLGLYTDEELTRSREAFKTEEKTCSVRFESKFKKSNEQEIDVEISSSVVDLKKGIMQGIVSDITARKELESALRDSEEKFRSFMETASDLMYITDKEGVFSYVNDAMANTLEYLKEELIGMHISGILDKDTLEASRLKHEELAAAGSLVHELVWETKNRKKIDGEMRVTAIYDDKGQFRGLRGVFRDISERKKVEKSQRLAQLGKLAADVAHEVNNPVTIISARAQLSLMEGDGKGLKNNLQIILDQCAHAKDIIKRLLMFSKPSKEHLEETDLNGSIGLVISLLEQQFALSKVKIKKKFASDLPSAQVNKGQMEEVFMNLLRNAHEAMPDGGTIIVSTSTDGGNIRIDFTDTGKGIAGSDLKKIMDPFFTTKEQGTGLGLSVCYGILKTHGGSLTYYSKPGEGTTATVLLPVRPPE